ncbi:MAG: hypothetical protein ACRECH_16260 [Nitrososphaerales archaeon]
MSNIDSSNSSYLVPMKERQLSGLIEREEMKNHIVFLGRGGTNEKPIKISTPWGSVEAPDALIAIPKDIVIKLANQGGKPKP